MFIVSGSCMMEISKAAIFPNQILVLGTNFAK